MKTILVDAVDTFVIEGEGVHKPMFDLLEQYPNRKIILTNADDAQIVQFGLIDLPYELFTMKHTPDKTEPAYFQEMLKHFGLETDEVIYFEHNPMAVKSAESLGIISYHYDAKTKDMINLKNFIDSCISQ